MSNFFTIDPQCIKDIERITKKLGDLPPLAIDMGMEAGTNYLLNVLVNKEIAPYQYISRAQAYPDAPAGPGWFSDKQRRFVMAAIRSGRIEIPFNRGGAYGIQSQWHISGSGAKVTLSNSSPGAKWVYGEGQPRQLGLVGWKKVTAIIAKYRSNIYSSFARGVNNAIKKMGLGQ